VRHGGSNGGTQNYQELGMVRGHQFHGMKAVGCGIILCSPLPSVSRSPWQDSCFKNAELEFGSVRHHPSLNRTLLNEACLQISPFLRHWSHLCFFNFVFIWHYAWHIEALPLANSGWCVLEERPFFWSF